MAVNGFKPERPSASDQSASVILTDNPLFQSMSILVGATASYNWIDTDPSATVILDRLAAFLDRFVWSN